jgi:hypothetical protein
MITSIKGLTISLALTVASMIGMGLFMVKPAHADPNCHYEITSMSSEQVDGVWVCDQPHTDLVPQPDPGPKVPSCMRLQNAMRPCGSDQRQVSKPAGVDPNLVGTWELPQPTGFWVLKVIGNGTYQFHSEARDGTPPNAGAFSASNGHWSLRASNGYTDGGSYWISSHDFWGATGQHGPAVWHRCT